MRERSYSTVLQVKFKTSDEQGAVLPSVIVSTSGGHLCSVAAERPGHQPESVFRKGGGSKVHLHKIAHIAHGINCFTFDPMLDQDVLACAASESLVYIHVER